MGTFKNWLEKFDPKPNPFMHYDIPDIPKREPKRDIGQEMRHLKQTLNIEKALKAIISTAREGEVTPELEKKALYLYDRLVQTDPVGARYWRKQLDEVGIDTSYDDPGESWW
jgi:hypothetical protein